MKLDLIEVETKLNRKKIIITIIVALIFIVLFSILGIKAAENYNKKLIAKRTENIIQEKLNSQQINEKNYGQTRQDNIENINNSEQIIENMNVNQIPVYHSTLVVFDCQHDLYKLFYLLHLVLLMDIFFHQVYKASHHSLNCY